jgi:Co/Zn/Cd efflux system component
MKACCEIGTEFATRQCRVLQVVLWVNAAMFLGEFGAGLIAHSTALLSDSVDMLGDAIVYGFSLYAVMRGPTWQARAALLKGTIMGAFGLGVLTEATLKMVHSVVPSADVIGGVGVVALAANVFCLVLLARDRGDDINMRSAWLCSRNDVVANVADTIRFLKSRPPFADGGTLVKRLNQERLADPARARSLELVSDLSVRTAKARGLPIPPSLLLRAHEVIE